MRTKILPVFFIFLSFCTGIDASLYAQTDTLRVMAYNVLNYGEYPLCQGANNIYHGYLETIVQFANPDIIGLEKMGSIKAYPTDHNYSAAIDFQDSILQYALNATYPGRYNYCTFTNNAGNNDFSMLFYNQQKLGFISITCNYPSTEDFNTYKFYYLDPHLATTHDTTFLYVTVNHDISGNGSEADRGAQIAGEMAQIGHHFTHLANMINMGDFNVRNSDEPCYQTLTAPADTDFRYYDPPFHPDATFSYPADWDSNPVSFASYLTTSTRQSGSIPNSCGTNGGAKDWYDHIFLSPWIVNNSNYISYIPHSFRVIGNDGNRVGISVNQTPANISAPAAVIDAIFQMSNKYPVMADLVVTQNTTGVSPPDPEIVSSSITEQALPDEHVTINNPIEAGIIMHFTSSLVGQHISFDCIDMLGQIRIHGAMDVDNALMEMPCDLKPGIYFVRISNTRNIICQAKLFKY